MPTAVEIAGGVYARWNEGGLAALAERVDPAVQLVCDPLRPEASALHGADGWRQWARRWERGYDAMRVEIDGLVPIGDDHVLALVTITATPKGASAPLSWAAAHVWTIRAGRIARWETHLDLALARRTLD